MASALGAFLTLISAVFLGHRNTMLMWFLFELSHLRCTKSGLKQITCPSGLAFDIDKQTCDWKGKVTNCDKLESKSLLKKRNWHLKPRRDGVTAQNFVGFAMQQAVQKHKMAAIRQRVESRFLHQKHTRVLF